MISATDFTYLHVVSWGCTTCRPCSTTTHAISWPAALLLLCRRTAGSAYHLAADASWAEWARWVEPTDRAHDVGGGQRVYLAWPTDREQYPVPDSFACALTAPLATFQPAAEYLAALGPLGATAGIPVSYPASAIYRLGAGCPGAPRD